MSVDETLAELLELSQRLLDAIAAGDWETYQQLCDQSLSASSRKPGDSSWKDSTSTSSTFPWVPVTRHATRQSSHRTCDCSVTMRPSSVTSGWCNASMPPDNRRLHAAKKRASRSERKARGAHAHFHRSTNTSRAHLALTSQRFSLMNANRSLSSWAVRFCSKPSGMIELSFLGGIQCRPSRAQTRARPCRDRLRASPLRRGRPTKVLPSLVTICHGVKSGAMSLLGCKIVSISQFGPRSPSNAMRRPMIDRSGPTSFPRPSTA